MQRIFLYVSLIAAIAAPTDRRVVDRITVGDTQSEEAHAYAGAEVTDGVARGLAFRVTRGWMRYALAVFDDTEVTIACTFLGSAAARTFDLVVENQVVASHTFRSAKRTTVEFRVPIGITKGRTNIIVMLRATNGSTPALVELRSVQDHNE